MNSTKVITIVTVMVVLFVIFPQAANAGGSLSIAVRIGGGSISYDHYDSDYIVSGGCYRPVPHRSIIHHDWGRRSKHHRRHYGGFHRIGPKYYHVTEHHSPVIIKKRVFHGFGGSHRKHRHGHGRVRYGRCGY
jgi:hypothetical protein